MDAKRFEHVTELRKSPLTHSKAVGMVIHNTTHQNIRAILMRGDSVIDEVELPDYGETKIVTHQAKVTFVEKATKEKVE